MPYDKKYDKVALKAAWEKWAKGERPDCPTLPDLAKSEGVPAPYLYKHSGKWGKALRADLQSQLQNVPGYTGTKTASRGIVRGKRERINADKTLPPSSQYTDEYRHARKLGKDAMAIAMQGLIHEATNGTGASRVSAIRELLDRAGLAKDKERKDEPSPYEDEDAKTLRDRMMALLGSNKMIASLLGVVDTGTTGTENPTTSDTTSTNPHNPFPLWHTKFKGDNW